mgnify:CR=1 FL=1
MNFFGIGGGNMVYLDITHTYIGDLVITLNGPGGQVHELHNKQGGSQDDIKKSFEITPAGAIASTMSPSTSINLTSVRLIIAWFG